MGESKIPRVRRDHLRRAVRSGKTLSMGMGFFLWAMRRFSGEQFALCGKTIVLLRRNVLHEIYRR
ncbi:MAG: hypothetical protein ACLRSD_07450 [Oscillibacter sp.]